MGVQVSINRCLSIDLREVREYSCRLKYTLLVISDSLAGHCQVSRHMARISKWKSSGVDSVCVVLW